MLAAGGSEGYFMSDEEWKAQVKMGAEVCKGRVPSVAGVFELSATEAVKRAQYAADVGCDFVQIAPPHYMVPTDDEVYHHFKIINDNVDIGIMAYNTPWAMPAPGYSFTENVLNKFLDLKNVEGVKWSSFDQTQFVTIARRFADKLAFIDNQVPKHLSLSIKLGFSGFINSDGLVAPRLVLHLWKLWKENRREEYDDLLLKLYVDPALGLAQPEDITWTSMGEGPHVRIGMEALGMKMGPSFPAQLPLSDASIRRRAEAFSNGGIMDWVDWRESLWEKAKK